MRRGKSPAPMSPALATECLRRKAVPELEIAFTNHFAERLEERGLVMGDVFHILKYGFVYEEAVPSTRAGLYKYLMESPTPNSGGRTVCISVIPYPSCAIKLVTIMWKHEKG
jgi:hypothetical protein